MSIISREANSRWPRSLGPLNAPVYTAWDMREAYMDGASRTPTAAEFEAARANLDRFAAYRPVVRDAIIDVVVGAIQRKAMEK